MTIIHTHTLIIGAGIAGAAAAWHLRAAGKEVLVVDAGMIASGASGNAVGVLYPHLTIDDSPTRQLSLAALAYSMGWYQAVAPQHSHASGVLLLEKSTPPKLHRYGFSLVDASICGVDIKEQGVLVEQAGWVRPAAVCAVIFKDMQCLEHTAVLHLEEGGKVHTTKGIISAKQVVVACGMGSAAFLPDIILRPVRGQINGLAATPSSAALTMPVCRNGYIAPAVSGTHWCGASFVRGSQQTHLDDAESLENLRLAHEILPNVSLAKHLAARASIRTTTPNHLPYYGQVGDNLWVLTGLGSRGLLYAPYLARGLAKNTAK